MEVVVAPSAIHIAMVNDYLTNNIQVGAQNVSKFHNGAYTSQISAEMLKDMDCNWTIIGHSERRHIMGETDMDVGMKAKSAIESGLKVVLCIGETMLERETHQTDDVNFRMLNAVANELQPNDWVNVVIAYEPVWAIGTGQTPKPDEVSETHSKIRAWLA
jgi:triosephosphate isomerase (TIM)